MVAFDTWLESVEGQSIDMDGAYGAQCWDLFDNYTKNVVGSPGISCTDTGYAVDLWTMFDSNGASAYYVQKPATWKAQPGAVAIWGMVGPATPLSHVAIVTADKGINVECATQNPGATRISEITKLGLKGYLVPKSLKISDDTSSDTDSVAGKLGRAAGDAVASGAPLQQAGILLKNLGDPQFWTRVGIFTLGAILTLIAILMLLKQAGAVDAGKSAVNKVNKLIPPSTPVTAAASTAVNAATS